MFCPKCGKEIKAEAKFCNHCGEVIKQEPIIENISSSSTTNISFAEPKEPVKNKDTKIKKTATADAVSPLDKISHKRMIIFSLIALVCILLVYGWSAFSAHQNIQDNLNQISQSNFFEIKLLDGSILENYGRVFIECGIEIACALFFMIVCLTAKKCKSTLTAIPIMVNVMFYIVWYIVIAMAKKMGVINSSEQEFTQNLLSLLPSAIFAIVYLLTVNGKIKISLLAKVLTVICGIIPVVFTFISMFEFFMAVDVSATNTYGTTYIALCLVATVLTFFAELFSYMAMLVYACNVRRKISKTEGE